MKKLKFYFSLSLMAASAYLYSCNPQSSTDSGQNEMLYETADESIYQMEGEWHTQNNDTIRLSELEGKIPVLSMGFTSCTYACPRLVEDMKNIALQVPESKKDELIYVLVSFDTENDHPERLHEFAREMELGKNWLLLHGSEEDVRELSMLLDISYKKQPNGHFAHSNNIILLDKKGNIVQNMEGLGANSSPLVEKITRL